MITKQLHNFFIPRKDLLFTCSKSIRLGKLAAFDSDTSKFGHVMSSYNN